MLEAGLACRAGSSVLIAFCPRRLRTWRLRFQAPGQGRAMQRFRTSCVSREEMGRQPGTPCSPQGASSLLRWSSTSDAGYLTGIPGNGGAAPTSQVLMRTREKAMWVPGVQVACNRCSRMSPGVQHGEAQGPAVNAVILECPAPEPLSLPRAPPRPPSGLLRSTPPTQVLTCCPSLELMRGCRNPALG